jgi:hypothetical protein
MFAPNSHTRTVGFGAAVGDWPHFWAVTIPADRRAQVTLSEDAGVGTDGPEHRETIDRASWNLLSPALQGDLNASMKTVGLKPSRFRIGENRMDRCLGEETRLLFIAARDQPAEAIPAVMANWGGMRPEERWWLCRKAAASPAWREAVRIGLAENPVK